jgi:hypothetical protein
VGHAREEGEEHRQVELRLHDARRLRHDLLSHEVLADVLAGLDGDALKRHKVTLML